MRRSVWSRFSPTCSRHCVPRRLRRGGNEAVHSLHPSAAPPFDTVAKEESTSLPAHE